jgi:thiol-disulfide isomerase/thioredoxin
MSKRTTVVYFYMIGCPHCEAMRPAWEDAKKKLKKGGMEVNEKESKQVGPMDGVQSFPTVVAYKAGEEVKRIEGSRDKGNEIVSELGLQRGSSRRGRTYRGKRKTRHRTLRNYKSFA